MPICANCGQENPDVARFCLACGADLAGEPAREERKVVTVLFADLVGFTSRAERMDPEDVRALLSPYYARLRTELERFGGTVEKFIGDAVMALFGAPVSHEDDPERAVRAALAIRDAISSEGKELQVRIAITTGEAIVALGARPSEGEGMAAGDVVNAAARLQAAAPVNGILVDSTTHRATRDAIVYEQADAVEAKGKSEPIQVWQAVEPRSRVGVERGHDAPLVGRSEEVQLLVDALARAGRERSPQLVTIVGVPGIGKSRLVYELFRSIETGGELVTWRQGRALPYGEAVTFWPLAEMVKAQAGILETDSAEAAGAKLRAAVEALDLEDAERVELQLRPLAGVGADDGPAQERNEAFAAWRRFFEALAESRPLVLLFEDLHWADDGVLDFVDHLVEWATDVPLLVVCTARPELFSRRPGWGGGKASSTTISLSPLSDEETARLLGTLMARAVLPAETQATLLAVAGGNPLYAEQYARMLAETERGGELSLPETVQGIIAARIDALSPEEKALLQTAAVVGRSFWLGAVSAIGELDSWRAEELLHGLERKEFVRRERRSSVEGDSEYAFRHLLVRDVAYGQIPRGGRARAHSRVAGWIESLGRNEDQAETLANHYLTALELSGASGEEAPELLEPARLAFRDAGDRAAALFAYTTARRFYEAALELRPEPGSDRAELLFRRAEATFHLDRPLEPLLEAREALAAAGQVERAAEAEMLVSLAHWSHGDPQKTLEHSALAAAQIADRPPSRAKAFVLANRARMLAVADHPDEALESGREALALASSLGLDDLRANALNTIGLARMELDDVAGIQELEQSLELALEHGSPTETTRIYNNLGWGYAHAGRMSEAVEAFEAGLTVTRQYGFTDQMRWALMMLAANTFVAGDWARSRALVDAVLERMEGTEVWRGMAFGIRADVRLGVGDLAGAWSDAQRALEDAPGVEESAGDRALSIALAARVAFASGRHAEAEALAAELDSLASRALEGMHAWDVMALTSALWELGRPLDILAESAAAYPRRVWTQVAGAIARGELVDAAERLALMGTRTYEAYTRLRAAEQLRATGAAAEADLQLEQALGFYRSVGARYYVRQGEALLLASA